MKTRYIQRSTLVNALRNKGVVWLMNKYNFIIHKQEKFSRNLFTQRQLSLVRYRSLSLYAFHFFSSNFKKKIFLPVRYPHFFFHFIETQFLGCKCAMKTIFDSLSGNLYIHFIANHQTAFCKPSLANSMDKQEKKKFFFFFASSTLIVSNTRYNVYNLYFIPGFNRVNDDDVRRLVLL